ncbi:hypothetical protein LCGC14_2201690 [marine sediment metagenome]|uniref:Uncharacterized protein n=1 Tax=marine sediment metagenome TaxID=412755 RepID=A0A0F9DGQ3_9ZZZZ
MLFRAQWSGCFHKRTTPVILGDSDGFKVSGTNALAVPTEMVNHKAVWNRAVGQLVGKAIGFLVAVTSPIHDKITVAVAVVSAFPKPAGVRLLNLLPESLLKRLLESTLPVGLGTPPLSLVVHRAQVLCMGLSRTIRIRTLHILSIAHNSHEVQGKPQGVLG